MFKSDCSKYERKIEKLEEELQEKEESIEYWKDVHNRDYEKINELKNNLKTLRSIMENLAPHQLRTIDIDDEYYDLLCFGNKAEAFHSPKDLGLKNYDYFILRNKSENRSSLVRVHKIKKIQVSAVYSHSKDMGFSNGDLCRRDIRFTYPDLNQNSDLWLYYIKIIS